MWMPCVSLTLAIALAATPATETVARAILLQEGTSIQGTLLEEDGNINVFALVVPAEGMWLVNRAGIDKCNACQRSLVIAETAASNCPPLCADKLEETDSVVTWVVRGLVLATVAVAAAGVTVVTLRK